MQTYRYPPNPIRTLLEVFKIVKCMKGKFNTPNILEKMNKEKWSSNQHYRAYLDALVNLGILERIIIKRRYYYKMKR